MSYLNFFKSDSKKPDTKPSDSQTLSQSNLKGSFESTGSVDLGFSASKKCYICNKNFNFRKKHICKFCQNAVCSDHSAKVRDKEGMKEAQRICDLCDQEEEKTVIKGLIDHEVSSLGEELRMAKETNDRLYKDHFEKTATVNQLEDELEGTEKAHLGETEKMHLEIDEIKEKKKEASELLEKMKEELRNSKKNQILYQNKTSTFVELVEDLSKKIGVVRERSEKAEVEGKRMEKFMQENFCSEKIAKSLCGKCSGKLTEALQRAHLKPVWEEVECLQSGKYLT